MCDKKSYISTADFRFEFYTYSKYFSNLTFKNTGTFALADSTGTKCPAGRILHETGRKLRPDMEPMTNFVGTLTEPKFLISVYDPISLLTGYIDPTSSSFAIYDTNYSPGEIDGQTNGLIYNSDGQGSKLMTGPTSGVGTLVIPLSTITSGAGGFSTPIQAGNATSGFVSLNNHWGVKVLTTAYNANSIVLLSPISDPVPTNVLSGNLTITYSYVSAGQFQISTNVGGGTNIIAWVIIN